MLRVLSSHIAKVSWPFVALIGGAVCIGLSPIFVRLSDLGPIAISFYRVFLAIPILWLVAIQQPPVRPASFAKITVAVMICAVFFSGDLIFWHLSLANTTVANATLLANISVIFVTLGAWWLFKQLVNRYFLLGMALALAGTVLLTAQSWSIDAQRGVGDLQGLGAALCYAGYLLGMSWARTFVATSTLVFFVCLVCTLILLPLAYVFEATLLPQTLYGWLPLLALAWISQALGQGLIAYGMGFVSAALSAVTLLIQPIIAGLLAWWLFAERLNAWQLFGALIIFSGIVICRLQTVKR